MHRSHTRKTLFSNTLKTILLLSFIESWRNFAAAEEIWDGSKASRRAWRQENSPWDKPPKKDTGRSVLTPRVQPVSGDTTKKQLRFLVMNLRLLSQIPSELRSSTFSITRKTLRTRERSNWFVQSKRCACRALSILAITKNAEGTKPPSNPSGGYLNI